MSKKDQTILEIEKQLSEMKPGGKITIVGFGTFSVVRRDARTGRNPQTGQAIQIPAKNTVKFKAGKPLIELVN